MELLYVYIENYREILKNKEFNFGGEKLFSYENSKLSMRDNNNYCRDFFGTNINNITAIIGKNGTGKTTLLNFILDNIASEKDTGFKFKDKAIIVFKENDNYLIYAHSEMIINNEEEFSIVRYGNDIKKIISKEVGIIKFSNIFDLSENGSNINCGYIDISTNNLLRNAKTINLDGDENGAFSQVDLFTIEEIYRQVELCFRKKILIDFDLPNEIVLSLNEVDYIDRLDELFGDNIKEKQLYCYDPDDLDRSLSNKKITEINNSSGKEKFLRSLIVLLINNIMYSCFTYKEINIENSKEDIKILIAGFFLKLSEKYNTEEDKYIHDNDDVFKNIPNILGKCSDIFTYLEQNLNKKNKLILSLIKRSENFYNYISNLDKCFLDDRIVLDDEKIIKNLLETYAGVNECVPLISVKWRGMSTGQAAMLSLYSRFYERRKGIAKSNIIIIDEGEVYFHPEWQKKLINNLINNLPIIFSDSQEDANFQFIFTSNSPFLISDLPNNNIIFLSENEQFNMNHTKTFGANIHELLSKTFFLDNTIGEFAFEKIKGVIRDLTEKINKKENKEIADE